MATTKTTPIAGSDVDSYCGKCRLDLAHIVVATRPGQAARVQCKTCGAQHAMRRAKAAAKPKTPKAPGAAKQTARAKKAVQQFEEASAGKDLSKSKTYGLAMTFAQGDVISHPNFGVGVVLKLSPERKMEVLFQETGMKVLAHARS